MNWSFRVREKEKLALALGTIFMAIVLANWFVNYSMEQLRGQFKSVYEDRLIPALDIGAITERAYQNHMLLEEHIITNSYPKKKNLYNKIEANQTQIDSILFKYEGTYLTSQENLNLTNYKETHQQLIKTQSRILQLSSANQAARAQNLYETSGRPQFLKMVKKLHALSKLQETVALELYASAKQTMQAVQVLSYAVIGMALVIALLVTTLLQTSKKLKAIQQDKFRLN